MRNRTSENRTGEPRPLEWTLSWALPWPPSWDVSWEFSWGILRAENRENQRSRGRSRGSTRGVEVCFRLLCALDFTLPALQKNFVNIFFVFAWEFCIAKWRGFLVKFFWSLSPTKRSTRSPRKIRRKFGAKFGANFGTIIRTIRETFVLQLFWPKFPPPN